MGIKNRARRAASARAKARARARAAAGTAGGTPPNHDRGAAGPTEHPHAEGGHAQGGHAQGGHAEGGHGEGGHGEGGHARRHHHRTGDGELAARLLLLATRAHAAVGTTTEASLRELLALDPRAVEREAQRLLLQCVGGLWRHGWQPAELARQARLRADAPAARLVLHAVAADHLHRAPHTLHERWAAQLGALELPEIGAHRWIASWRATERLDHRAEVAAIVAALALVSVLPTLEVLLPPPGTTAGEPSARWRPAQGGSAAADPLLERIRNLLAKAESTTFEAEAEAFTAKAYELMTRHAIDEAALAGTNAAAMGGGGSSSVTAIRVPIDPPYVDAKSLLLQRVAEANRCRAVFHTGLAMSTVAGHGDDLRAVELLFTSLLVQAQTAMAAAALRSPAGGRTRRRGYRAAFLTSYAVRIGERLAEVSEAVIADVTATQGASFLPVLRSRAEQVDAFVHETFGRLTSAPVRGHDPEGWASGRVAADNAKLAYAEFAAASAPTSASTSAPIPTSTPASAAGAPPI